MKRLKSLGKILSGPEMKRIIGGDYGCSCAYASATGSGTCQVRYNGQIREQNIPKAEAERIANHCVATSGCSGWTWCCDSC